MANNSEPYEIIAAPFEIYIGDVGSTFPAIDATPSTSDWTLVGKSGSENYTQDGVTISHEQSFNTWRSLGSPAPRKVFRTEENLVVSATVVDVRLETYAYALNSNSIVTTSAETAADGYKTIGLSRGLSLATNALLVRGPSPEGADMNSQYEVPIAVQTGSPEVVYSRGEPAGLALQWTALVNSTSTSDDQKFGRLVVAHEAATGV